MALTDNPSVVELIGAEVLDQAEDDADHIFRSLEKEQFQLSEKNVAEAKRNIMTSFKKVPLSKSL